jgi:hypothetical protein
MEEDTGNENHALSPEEKAAKAAILAECDKLGNASVTFVAATLMDTVTMGRPTR